MNVGVRCIAKMRLRGRLRRNRCQSYWQSLHDVSQDVYGAYWEDLTSKAVVFSVLGAILLLDCFEGAVYLFYMMFETHKRE